MITVKYESNNSGGSWWLSTEIWEKLEEAGWIVHWIEKNKGSTLSGVPESSYKEPLKPCPREGGNWLGCEAKSAAKQFNTIQEAISEWEIITGQNAAEEGCNCCPPHTFEWTDENGLSHYSSVEVTGTRLVFN